MPVPHFSGSFLHQQVWLQDVSACVPERGWHRPRDPPVLVFCGDEGTQRRAAAVALQPEGGSGAEPTVSSHSLSGLAPTRASQHCHSVLFGKAEEGLCVGCHGGSLGVLRAPAVLWGQGVT